MTNEVTMSNLTISKISGASPEMADEEFSELMEDIRLHSQLLPIWMRDGEIIDGRKRFMACQKLGIEPKMIDLSPEQDPENLAYSLNILRTQYTPSQRAMFAAKRATATKRDAVMMRRDRQKDTTAHLLSYPKTVSQASKEVAVSATLTTQAKSVLRRATPEVVSAVERGELTLHAARQIIKTTRKESQPQAVDTVVKASAGKSNQQSARALGAWDGSRRQPKRNIPECIQRGLDQLENTVGLLEELFTPSGLNGNLETAEWSRRLGKCRTRLSTLIHTMRKERAS